MKNQDLQNWKKSIKEFTEEHEIKVLIKETGVYIEDYVDTMDLDELKQFHIILRLIHKNYLRFGNYIKLDFYKRPNGEIYSLNFLAYDRKYEFNFFAMQFTDYDCKINNELEYLKYILKNKYIPLQTICDNKIHNNRGKNNLREGDKITTWKKGVSDLEFSLERIQFHNKHKDTYVFSNDIEKEKYVFLDKNKDRYACERLLSMINMSEFFKEVLYTPLKKELKKPSEILCDHIGWRYYHFFYHLFCSYLDLNDGSMIDNPYKLDLSIVKNKRGNIDVKISLVPEDKTNYTWIKFMAYRNIDTNNKDLKDEIEKLGFNEGILNFVINGGYLGYNSEINYPKWVWNKKYKNW